MMSDLADIAAAAGISIVDTPLSEGGDVGHPDNLNQVCGMPAVMPDGSGDTSLLQEQEALESLFSYRYTNDDPDYVKTVTESDIKSRPPCVESYFGRRQRDNSRPWQRDRNYRDYNRDGRGYRGRGDYHNYGDRNERQGYDRGRDWNKGYHNRDKLYRDRSPR